MAKTAGDIRSSKWIGDIYTVNGVRKEYYELPDERKKAVRILSDKVSKSMYSNLKDKQVTLNTDKDEITVHFTKKATDHVARDAMMILSGKYMSKKTMINIDKILAKSEYVKNPNILTKSRKDGKSLFFRYVDKTGRGIYFKVAYEKGQKDGKYYYLYSVVDK